MCLRFVHFLLCTPIIARTSTKLSFWSMLQFVDRVDKALRILKAQRELIDFVIETMVDLGAIMQKEANKICSGFHGKPLPRHSHVDTYRKPPTCVRDPLCAENLTWKEMAGKGKPPKAERHTAVSSDSDERRVIESSENLWRSFRKRRHLTKEALLVLFHRKVVDFDKIQKVILFASHFFPVLLEI